MQPISFLSLPTHYTFAPEKNPTVGKAMSFALNPVAAMTQEWLNAIKRTPDLLTNPPQFMQAYSRVLMVGAASAFWTWSALMRPPGVTGGIVPSGFD